MYEEIKDTLIEIALTGIKSIIESDRKRSIDKAKLNYLITKHFLPRKLWGEEV